MGGTLSQLLARLHALVRPPPAAPAPPPYLARHDEDGDGRITPDEFERTFLALNGRPPARADWWDFLGRDRDGDACVTAEEARRR